LCYIPPFLKTNFPVFHLEHRDTTEAEKTVTITQERAFAD